MHGLQSFGRPMEGLLCRAVLPHCLAAHCMSWLTSAMILAQPATVMRVQPHQAASRAWEGPRADCGTSQVSHCSLAPVCAALPPACPSDYLHSQPFLHHIPSHSHLGSENFSERYQ